MAHYIIRRLWQSVPLLIGITLVTFILTEAMPGDYVSAMMPPEETAVMSEQAIHELRTAYGLDRPPYIRYLLWVREVVKGNLGFSLASGEPVVKEIWHYLPNTLLLTVTALIFSIVIGITLGIISAVKQYTWLDQILTVLGFVWISTPGFVFAIGAIFLFSLRLHLLPTSGMSSYGQETGLLDALHHLILPAMILGLNGIARYMRYTRTSVLDVIRQDYLTVARAKGLSKRVVLLRHAVRNALIPVITIIGLDVPWVLSGAIIIETIFAWPGMGTYYIVAVGHRNYSVIMGVNLIFAIGVLISNLIADICYAAADPRIRYE